MHFSSFRAHNGTFVLLFDKHVNLVFLYRCSSYLPLAFANFMLTLYHGTTFFVVMAYSTGGACWSGIATSILL